MPLLGLVWVASWLGSLWMAGPVAPLLLRANALAANPHPAIAPFLRPAPKLAALGPRPLGIAPDASNAATRRSAPARSVAALWTSARQAIAGQPSSQHPLCAPPPVAVAAPGDPPGEMLGDRPELDRPLASPAVWGASSQTHRLIYAAATDPLPAAPAPWLLSPRAALGDRRPWSEPAPPAVKVVRPHLGTIASLAASAARRRPGTPPETRSESLADRRSVTGPSRAALPPLLGFQVWVRGRRVANLPDRVRADLLADRLTGLLAAETPPDPAQLYPAIVGDGIVAGKLGDRVLFAIDAELADWMQRDPQAIAVEWVNSLRVALDGMPLSLANAQVLMHDLVETGQTVEGLASWYGPGFHGRLTASGEPFDQLALTAAHKTLPFGTYLRVKNLQNGREAIVQIDDRGPYIEPRMLDLSRGAARCLGAESAGVVPVTAEVLLPRQALAAESGPAAPVSVLSARPAAPDG